jgi:CheY-like chemotaxis protein
MEMRQMPHLQIVIIEDDYDLRETMKDLLEMEGFSVVTAANGREGLNLIARDGKPCLILLDLMMPVMNGWEFLDAMQRDQQDLLAQTKVAVLSAAADIAEVQQQYGCRVLKKPVSVDRLYALAHAACDGC